jgi:hypothetical protein
MRFELLSGGGFWNLQSSLIMIVRDGEPFGIFDNAILSKK